MEKIKIKYRNRLPHIAPIGATFFVTFRLGDSLLAVIVEQLRKKMIGKVAQLKKEKPTNYEELIRREHKLFFKNYDRQLDVKPYGECFLKIPAIAKIIMDKLHELDGDKYTLIAYTIMPNHVHVLFDTAIQITADKGFFLDEIPENYTQLYKIMKNIKGSTACITNKHLKRKGTFWQKDSYDHYIRNEKEFENIVQYILQNPVKAGLVKNWQAHPFTHYNNAFVY